MKIKRIVALFLILCFTFLGTSLGCNDTQINNSVYLELGIPTKEKHEQGVDSRVVWDMKLWEDKLFIGGGDYDKNTGPVDIWCYDLKAGAWNLSGTVEDEAIVRFIEIDDQLIVPGIDPREDWSYGNYYKYNGKTWDKVRSIEGGIHNFDMIKFDGKIFAGIGVNTDPEILYPLVSPIACSSDGGQTFTEVPMFKGDLPYKILDKNVVVRTYELISYQNKLYAVVREIETQIDPETAEEKVIRTESMLFKYENGAFYYWYSLNDKNLGNALPRVSLFGAETEFKGRYYFTTGYLYCTTDMENFEKVDVGGHVVCDILVENGVMYVLCGKGNPNKKDYVVSVYKSTTGLARDFLEVFKFDYPAPAISFEKYGDAFYLGVGNKGVVNDYN